jgi:TPR repeat protein
VGNVIAQTTLGLAYRNGSILWRSNPKAVRWFQAAADQGFAIAENELGEMYYLGRGVDKDVAASIPLFEKAAAAGYTVAKLNLLQAKAGNEPMKWVELLKPVFNAR